MSGPYSTAKLLLDSNGSPVIMSGSDQDEDIALVSVKANPLTGGSDFLGPTSTLKLPVGVTDLSLGVGIDTAELDAAVAAAQAARDAAIIGAGVYTTEPIGRAAVADGVAFKVQGTSDIAAYEYRRTNASASVLIATYPSLSGAAKPTERIIGDYGVAAGATNFIGAVGTNLFNYLEAITGCTISATTGDLSVSAANSVSSLIPVTEGLHYYVHAAYFPRIAWYSANLGFISSTTTTGDVVAPAGARYLRAVCANAAVSYAYINAVAVWF